MRRVVSMHGGAVAASRSFERSHVGCYGAHRDPVCNGIRSGRAKARERTIAPKPDRALRASQANGTRRSEGFYGGRGLTLGATSGGRP
eukprot:6584078-Prymnesium_polylepis.2